MDDWLARVPTGPHARRAGLRRLSPTTSARASRSTALAVAYCCTVVGGFGFDRRARSRGGGGPGSPGTVPHRAVRRDRSRARRAPKSGQRAHSSAAARPDAPCTTGPSRTWDRRRHAFGRSRSSSGSGAATLLRHFRAVDDPVRGRRRGREDLQQLLGPETTTPTGTLASSRRRRRRVATTCSPTSPERARWHCGPVIALRRAGSPSRRWDR
jgi:hypothetical protein